MQEVIQATVRLFYNVSNRTYYIQLDNCLVPMNQRLAGLVQERLQLEIFHAEDIKAIQIQCIEYEKKLLDVQKSKLIK